MEGDERGDMGMGGEGKGEDGRGGEGTGGEKMGEGDGMGVLWSPKNR